MGEQNTTWFTQMLVQFEQQALYNAYNFSIGIDGPVGSDGMPIGFAINSTVYGTKLPAFQCPSDNDRTLNLIWPTNGYVIVGTRGNYVVSWGNTQWAQQNSAGGTATLNLPVVYMPSAFGHGSIRLASITDGTSNTVFTAEMPPGPGQRRPGCGLDPGRHVHEPVHPEQLEGFLRRGRPAGRRRRPARRRVLRQRSRQGSCPASTVPYPFLDMYPASRSRHPGGVNAGFGDGSVRFIKDTIGPVIWIGLNTIRGGEVLSSDSY